MGVSAILSPFLEVSKRLDINFLVCGKKKIFCSANLKQKKKISSHYSHYWQNFKKLKF